MSDDKNAVRKILDQAKAAGREALTAPEARGVCEAYGITIPKEGVAGSADEAGKLASAIGFPVVMKIVSPQILHKTEAGGVIVGVKSAEQAKEAYTTIVANARKYDAKAEILGVQVQQMLTGGQEVIIGAVTDPGLRQAGGVWTRRDPGGSSQGHHVPARARVQRGCAVDVGRHSSGGNSARRPRCQAGGSRGALRHDRAGVGTGRGLSRKFRRWT